MRCLKKGFAYIFACIWALLTIFPLYITFLSSLKDNRGINLSMFSIPKTFLWSNYISAFKNAGMGRAVFNSIFLALSSTILVIIIGMMAAYIFSRKRFILKRFIFTVFVLGVMIPVHCTIIPISSLANRMGGKNRFWFLILVYAAFNIAQAIFLFTSYINGIDRQLDEAAIIDGCNDFELLTRILVPISTPIIATVAILTFIFGYGELIFATVLLTDEKMYTISRAMLAFSGARQQQLGPIFACIIIAVLPMIILYVLFHEKVQAGILGGAVKG